MNTDRRLETAVARAVGRTNADALARTPADLERDAARLDAALLMWALCPVGMRRRWATYTADLAAALDTPEPFDLTLGKIGDR